MWVLMKYMMFNDECGIIESCVQRFCLKLNASPRSVLRLFKDCGIYDKMVLCYDVLGEESDDAIDEKVQCYIDRYLQSMS